MFLVQIKLSDTISAAFTKLQLRLAPLAIRLKIFAYKLQLMHFMVMRITVFVSFPTIHCISRDLDLKTLRLAREFLLAPIPRLDLFDMLRISIGFNFSTFRWTSGTRTSTLSSVRLYHYSHLLFTDRRNTGKFLFNNYKQAITIISDYTPDIIALKAVMPGLADEDFVKWKEEESQYLRSLRQEPEYNMQVVAYVEALEAVKKAKQVFSSAIFLRLF